MNQQELLARIKQAINGGWSSLDLNLRGIEILPEIIGDLQHLRMLYLSGNKLKELPDSIGKLTKLEVLDLSDNELTELPPSIGNLKSLHTLRLGGNKLKRLPNTIDQLKKLVELELEGNNFVDIEKEIFRLSAAEIINHLQQNVTHDKGDPFHEAKVIILGNPGVGKTSLLRRLKDEGFDEGETPTQDVNIHHLTVKRGRDLIRLHLWDFGQEEMDLETFKLFMSPRTLYLLLIDPYKEQTSMKDSPGYWLRIIKRYGKDAPILVAMPRRDEQRNSKISWGKYRESYPIIDVISYSSKTEAGIPELKGAISQALRYLHYLDDALPSHYHKVKRELRAHNKKYITHKQFEMICRKNSTKFTDKNIYDLANLLHDLGSIIHFADDIILEGTYILKPEWITQGVKQIINSPILKSTDGVLRVEYLNRIMADAQGQLLIDYPREKHFFLLTLMAKFEFIRPVPDQRYTYLIPKVFTKKLPGKFNNALIWSDQILLKFQYVYSIDPTPIVERVMSRFQYNIVTNIYWQLGVLIEWEDTQARIECKPNSKQIRIIIRGKSPQRLLHVIRYQFLDIHKKHNIKAKEMIPGTCKYCRNDAEKPPCLFSYSILDKLLNERKKDVVMCHESGDMLQIAPILTGKKTIKSGNDDDFWEDDGH